MEETSESELLSDGQGQDVKLNLLESICSTHGVPDGSRVYGISAEFTCDGVTVTREAPDISDDSETVMMLIKRMQSYAFCIDHFDDIIADFVEEIA